VLKKQDALFLAVVAALFAPFFVSGACYAAYVRVNAEHGFLLSAVKFGVLATMGEVIALRIRTGRYHAPGFGIVPRAIVWALLGVAIKGAFVVFGVGAPQLLHTLGLPCGPEVMKGGVSVAKVAGALAISASMNMTFAPVMMLTHKVTDEHIARRGGTVRGLLSPVPVMDILQKIDWKVMWGFVLKKTIPLFWIPAHTVTFLLPAQLQILFAALLGVALGVLLAIGSLRSRAPQAPRAPGEASS